MTYEEFYGARVLLGEQRVGSRIAEIVALTVVIMSALAEIARGVASMFGGHK